MVNRMESAPEDEDLLTTIYEATIEVASAVITAVATTVISFIPVFTMEAAEGKLFKPLAFTKTFALVASIIIAITVIPALAHSLFSIRTNKNVFRYIGNALLVIAGIVAIYLIQPLIGIVVLLSV